MVTACITCAMLISGIYGYHRIKKLKKAEYNKNGTLLRDPATDYEHWTSETGP